MNQDPWFVLTIVFHDADSGPRHLHEQSSEDIGTTISREQEERKIINVSSQKDVSAKPKETKRVFRFSCGEGEFCICS